MNKLVYKLTTAVSTAALLTGSVASVAFGTTTVTISGNGSDSENDANVTVNTSKTIFQTNTADIDNNVKISANSGDNEASDNTGGDVAIKTGDANVSSSVSNSANSNVASLDCGSCPGDLNVKISGNGADSDNKADVDVNNAISVVQANYANVDNDVDVSANTGGNEAEDNTGGEVEIETGDAKVEVAIENMVNSNVAHIGGGDEGGSVDVEISGNGADSDNDVYLDLNNYVEVFQNNVADIDNDVDVWANSGDNKAEDNTGGQVGIDTGDADVSVDVTNKANFNGLNLDDCCELDLDIKVAGNGSDSDNKADVELNSALVATQDNRFDCDGGQEYSYSKGSRGGDCNDIEVASNTGDNKAEDNTVGDDEDPSIETGDAGADVEVSTEANSNVLGNLGDLEMPDLPDMGDLDGWILLLMGHFSN